MYICYYTCIYISACLYIIYINIYIYTYIYNIYIIYIYIYMYIYTYIYTYIHTHIYIYFHIQWLSSNHCLPGLGAVAKVGHDAAGAAQIRRSLGPSYSFSPKTWPGETGEILQLYFIYIYISI